MSVFPNQCFIDVTGSEEQFLLYLAGHWFEHADLSAHQYSFGRFRHLKETEGVRALVVRGTRRHTVKENEELFLTCSESLGGALHMHSVFTFSGM